MSVGLYPNSDIVERFLASVSASTLTQRFIAPADYDVIGMLLYVSTAPGATDGVSVQISNFPTSQQGGSNSSVSAYNLWTTANLPTILGTNTTNAVTSNSTTVIENIPYALNYPLPGPAGSVGYATAQATSQTTTNPVVAPPSLYKFQMTGGLVVPDNTYTDYNGITAATSIIHAGDVLSFVVGAAGSNASVGSAANLEIALYLSKR